MYRATVAVGARGEIFFVLQFTLVRPGFTANPGSVGCAGAPVAAHTAIAACRARALVKSEGHKRQSERK